LSADARRPADVVAALAFLPHLCHVRPPSGVTGPIRGDLVLLDARRDITAARTLSRRLGKHQTPQPVLAVLTEAGVGTISTEWAVDDLVLDTVGRVELQARIVRAVLSRIADTSLAGDPAASNLICLGPLEIDKLGSCARLAGQSLGLAPMEFDLLSLLAQHPGRVFTRRELFARIWGYRDPAGSRTVDVHIGRLRIKFGPSHAKLIGTVRGVGYKFIADQPSPSPVRSPGSGAPE